MKVKLSTKEVEINKLPLGKYAELLKVLNVIPSKLGDIFSLPTNEMVLKLPAIIGENMPEVISIVSIGSGLPEEEIQTLDLVELIDIIQTIIEVNRYAEVYARLKKVGAQLQQPAKTQLKS